ncbi:DUF4365 domain-containing protein [Nocardia spumae]|uniref:DUF4365 domain-containing protein n=1 Tax=Nocardia spumae TaxID=2887190 RepID=UPI001D14F9B9|nr:DUF4365 domain-containing protein [Nocardia spumae]
MRASEQERIGSTGQSAVERQFKSLGWGVTDNAYHDLGTDLWLMVRDDRRFDLGLLIGAQVKTSENSSRTSKYFKEPIRSSETGEVTGWVFRESRDHFHYWLNHSVVHLVVLHDLETGTSYWAHVTTDAVEWTERAGKLTVPKTQTVCQDMRDKLVEAAATQRSSPGWEGSAWSEANDISPRDELRHALITPRLVAPHPNSEPDTVSAIQSIAMLTLCRMNRFQSAQDIERLTGKTSPYRSIEILRQLPEWDWKLFTAIYDFINQGSLELFPPLLEASITPGALANRPEQHAAAVVVYAAALIENGQSEQALVELESALDLDKSLPMDNAWLRVQKARALRELGNIRESRDVALDVQRVRATSSHDPTGTAIAAAAAELIFATSGWGERNLAQAISDSDTLAGWWRNQQVAWGLGSDFGERFEDWANTASLKSSIKFGSSNSAWLHLRSATLMSGFAGDQSGWRHALSLLSRHILGSSDSDSSVDLIAGALTDLRRSGDSDSLELALNRIVLAGPALAARNASRDVDLDESTVTSANADLKLITCAADILEADEADRYARWALRILEDPEEYCERVQPTFAVRIYVLKMLAALVSSTSEVVASEVVAHIVNLPAQSDQAYAHSYAAVVRAIPSGSWTTQDRSGIHAREGDNWELHNALSALLAENDEEAREQLLDAARGGSWRALIALNSASSLPGDVVAAQITALGEGIRNIITEASRHAYANGRRGFGRALTLLNAWHPEWADWNPIKELLSDPRVDPRDISGSLTALTEVSEKLTDEIKNDLEAVIRNLELREGVSLLGWPGVQHLATEVLEAFRPGSVSTVRKWSLITSGPEQRKTLARIIERRRNPEELDLFAVLADDTVADVRAEVGWCVARWVTLGVAIPESSLLLETLLARDTGTLLARYVAAALSGTEPSETVVPHLEMLSHHTSSAARKMAFDGLGRREQEASS